MVPVAGIYIHIPFCSQFCNYCDFYSTTMLGERDGFTEALVAEIVVRSVSFIQKGFKVGTVYIGGGTPSVLSAGQLGRILESVLSRYPVSVSEVAPPASDSVSLMASPEITVELNPDDVSLGYARDLFSLGFNRVSLGIQSFNDAHLSWMNRRHNSAKALEAFGNLRKAGFRNISIDLIFGFESLSTEEWRRNIELAIELSPEHLSCYQLGIEKGTKLYRSYMDGSYDPMPDEGSNSQYALLQELLSQAGYVQYEVSSFCKPGFESRHNSSYWDFTPYFGFGPSAHTFDGVCREWNDKGINKYILGWGQGIRGFKSELLSLRDHLNEFIMLSLRTVKGMETLELSRLLDNYAGSSDSAQTTPQIAEFKTNLHTLLEQRHLHQTPTHIQIPPHNLFLSDTLIRTLIVASLG